MPELKATPLGTLPPATGPVVLQDAAQTAEALAEALGRGWSVRLRRLALGFELTLEPPDLAHHRRKGGQGAVRGFSRRGSSRLLEAAEAQGLRLWARPAGPAWPGWTEWGTVAATD